MKKTNAETQQLLIEKKKPLYLILKKLNKRVIPVSYELFGQGTYDTVTVGVF